MRIIAIANQKGGCGKTTTAINLSDCLAANGRKVLLIDLDPQAHASIGLGIEVEGLQETIYDVFSDSDGRSLDDVIVRIDDNFDLAPSQLILSAVEQELAGKTGRESVLLRSIHSMRGEYDYLIVDCPPSLGLLTFNALRACGEALIPIDMSVFSLQGVARLLEMIQVLKAEYRHDVRPRALGTICNPNTLFAPEVLKNIEEHFAESMYSTVIHATVKLKEAAGFGVPIREYSANCRGADDYRALAGEVVAGETRTDIVSSPARLGPQQAGGQVTFRYYDPDAREVRIAGDFSNWEALEDLMILQEDDKVWEGLLQLTSGRYQYKYIVDGEWKTDPHNHEVTTSDAGTGNSLLTVSEQ